MASFGPDSLKKLATVHPDLRRVLEKAILVTDFTVLCGHRTEVEQKLAFANGASKLLWPESRHNSIPSQAVDIAPYPVDWTDAKRWHFLAGVVLGIAQEMGVAVTWGGRWAKFPDMPHFELAK